MPNSQTPSASAIPLSAELARWAAALRFEDLPADVVDATKWRVLDVIGLALAGGETPFGKSVLEATLALSSAGNCRVIGSRHQVAVGHAAFANGAFSQALEYDDTHNESIVHMSSPAVAAALAMADSLAGSKPVSGRDLITAVALGNEISCRVGSVSSGELHKRGFHPTGLFATFGAAYLASKLLGLDAAAMARAAGIAGSFAGGLLECWVDGTQTKFLHPGWSAQSGITAAHLANAGTTGPAAVFEGRWGLFATHVQADDAHRDFSRINASLGTHWESRAASFKPFPSAHVIHPYISAAIRLHKRLAEMGVPPEQIARVDCPVTQFIVGIVCEPTSEKFTPATDSHGRVSLPYSVAEALYRGRLGKTAYSETSLRDPAILALTRKVAYHVDAAYPGPGRFKGEVKLTLADGRVMKELEEYNRGSAENPMTPEELRAKFDENASGLLNTEQRAKIVELVDGLGNLDDASKVINSAQPR